MKPKILIVEDEPAIIDTIQYALETEGLDTLAVTAGQPALDTLDRENIDLIVLDVCLPDINGLDLLKLIRRESDVPVVFLTARSGDLDRVLGLELGGDDYIVKPFSPRELAARVKAVLRRSQKSAPAPQPPCIWQVDDKKRSIAYFGTALDLSPYEYNLLKVFLHNPGQVFSRDQLMDLAWDEPDTVTDRAIDAHIKNLRSKLRAVRPTHDPFVTHRGIGYALKETQ